MWGEWTEFWMKTKLPSSMWRQTFWKCRPHIKPAGYKWIYLIIRGNFAIYIYIYTESNPFLTTTKRKLTRKYNNYHTSPNWCRYLLSCDFRCWLMAQRVDNARLWCHTALAMRRRTALWNLRTSWETTRHLCIGLRRGGPEVGIGTPSPLVCFMWALLPLTRVNPLQTQRRDERLQGWPVMADPTTVNLAPWNLEDPCLDQKPVPVRLKPTAVELAPTCRERAWQLAPLDLAAHRQALPLTWSHNQETVPRSFRPRNWPGSSWEHTVKMPLWKLEIWETWEPPTAPPGRPVTVEVLLLQLGRLVAPRTSSAGLVGHGKHPLLYCPPNWTVPLSRCGGTEVHLATPYTQSPPLPGEYNEA